MAVLKVYGPAMSTNVMRVIACLYEKELDFELVPVDMAKHEHKKEPFLAISPFGQVPAFEDGDLKLFESRAITRYIATEYASKGTQLLHDGNKANAVLDVGLEVEAHQFNMPSAKLAFEIVFKPFFGMTADEAAIKEYEASLGKVLDVYEFRLSESKYLAGDKFTLVDLHHAPNIHYLMNTPVKKLFESRPHVIAWCTDILSRPAWLKVVKFTLVLLGTVDIPRDMNICLSRGISMVPGSTRHKNWAQSQCSVVSLLLKN